MINNTLNVAFMIGFNKVRKKQVDCLSKICFREQCMTRQVSYLIRFSHDLNNQTIVVLILFPNGSAQVSIKIVNKIWNHWLHFETNDEQSAEN